jgi:hypothetical protein
VQHIPVVKIADTALPLVIEKALSRLQMGSTLVPFLGVLTTQHEGINLQEPLRITEAGVSISMDGRGRVFDNIFVERLWRTVKFEELYLKAYETVSELLAGLGRYFESHNHERFHQGLGYQTPAAVYRGAPVIQRAPNLS